MQQNPAFVDADGPDNILGYSTAGAGYDGGLDDNFLLSRNSPGIDRGNTWNTSLTDGLNLPRVDDPGTANAELRPKTILGQTTKFYKLLGFSVRGWAIAHWYEFTYRE